MHFWNSILPKSFNKKCNIKRTTRIYQVTRTFCRIYVFLQIWVANCKFVKIKCKVYQILKNRYYPAKFNDGSVQAML